jgi:hypothetical protein
MILAIESGIHPHLLKSEIDNLSKNMDTLRKEQLKYFL